jgi:hypothetical protein
VLVNLAGPACGYVVAVALTAVLWPRPWLLLGALIVWGGVLLWRWHTRSDLVFFFLSLVLGPLAEGVAIAAGAWAYTRPLWLIPVWLPLLWGIAALTLRRIALVVLRETA